METKEAGGLIGHPSGRPPQAWRRVAALAAALALIATCAAVGSGAQAWASSGRPLFTGISGVYDIEQPATMDHVRASGASFVRIHAEWNAIAPQKEPSEWQPEDPGDAHYNWKAIDAAITGAIANGLTPVLSIELVPSWAQHCQSPLGVAGAPCEPDPAALASFATAAARRYSGQFQGLPRVRYWQGLNEPNLSLFFNPQFDEGRPASPNLYRKLINAFYLAVKAVNPSNLVLAAGLGPLAVPQYTIGPMRFARELLCMTGRHDPHPTRGNCEGGVHFDIFDVHPYTTGGPTHKGHVDDVELGDLGKLQELLRAADKAGRIHGKFRHTPLWITEFSWDSKPPDPGGLPFRILKRWTAEALYRAWSTGVSHFFWYSLRDQAPNPKLPFSETLQSGLYFRGTTVARDKPKPSMRAFRFPFVAYSRKSGFFFWGRTPTSTSGRVAIEVREGGQWHHASVAHANANGIFTGAVLTTYGRHERGMVRARYRGEEAVPFSLHPVKDFYQAPFGNPVG